MTVEVELPDGTIVEFPKDTPRQVMESALKQYSAQSAPKAAGSPWGRELGLGARNVVSGITDVAGIVTNPLMYGLSKVTGQPYESFSDAAGRAMDSAGLPRPQGAQERVGSDIGRALSGTALTMGAGAAAGPANRIGSILASQPGLQSLSAASGSGAAGYARESGATPGQQAAIGLAAGLAPGVAQVSGSAAVRGIARGGEAGRLRMDQGNRDFRSLGVEPSVGQATGNRRTQGLESLLSGSPTSAGVMAGAAERQAVGLGQGLQNKAESFYRNASGERAGRAIERGVDTFASNVKATRGALYDKADALIPDATRSPLANTRQALADLTTPTVGAESTTAAMLNPKIARIAQTVSEDLMAAQSTGSGGLPYAAIKDVRSRIGAELSDFSLTTDKPTAEYKRLYAALSQDMELAAQGQGAGAVQAVKRANAYFKASADRIEQVERVVDKAGGPEKVYSAAMSGTHDGGSTMRAVMQSLPSEGQKAVTAAVLKRMGLATKGNQDAAGEVFSSQTFLTNWNGVSAEAKRALFNRHGPRFVADMDKIARVSERIAKGSKVFANPSGSAKLGGALVYAGSLATSVLTGQLGAAGVLAATGAGAHVTARMMVNPRFVSWLARATEMPLAALPSQAIVLQGIAEKDDDEEMRALAESLRKTAPK